MTGGNMLFFFGVVGGELGHDLWCSETERMEPFYIDGVWQFENKRRVTIPWERIDGALCPGKRCFDVDDAGVVAPEHQHEGAYSLHHAEGWTALAWWDRSGRHGYWSNAALIAKGHRSATTMLEKGREHFPNVMARMTYPFRVGRFYKRPKQTPPALELVPLEVVSVPVAPTLMQARLRRKPVHETQAAFAW